MPHLLAKPLTSLVNIVFVAGMAMVALGFGERFSWKLALFHHFGWQGLIGMIAAAVWWSWRKELWLAMGSFALGLALCLSMAWPWQRPDKVQKDAASAAPGLRVLCFNALFSSPQVKAQAAYILEKSAQADVVALVEFSPSLELQLAALKHTHPHGVQLPDPSPWGLAIYSRQPLTRCDFHLGEVDEGPVAIDSVLEWQGSPLRLIVAHPWPPLSATAERRTTEHLQLVREAIEKESTLETAVMGDFNAAPWSSLMRQFCSGPRHPLGFRSTTVPLWPTWRYPSAFALSIDHVVCTPGLLVTDREIGPELGSDHRVQEFLLKRVPTRTSP